MTIPLSLSLHSSTARGRRKRATRWGPTLVLCGIFFSGLSPISPAPAEAEEHRAGLLIGAPTGLQYAWPIIHWEARVLGAYNFQSAFLLAGVDFFPPRVPIRIGSLTLEGALGIGAMTFLTEVGQEGIGEQLFMLSVRAPAVLFAPIGAPESPLELSLELVPVIGAFPMTFFSVAAGLGLSYRF